MHPSVMTAGVCSPSVPADHGAAFAGRVCRRVQASTSGSPSRNHPLSHAAIARRSTPRLASYGVGFFRNPRCGTSWVRLRETGAWDTTVYRGRNHRAGRTKTRFALPGRRREASPRKAHFAKDVPSETLLKAIRWSVVFRVFGSWQPGSPWIWQSQCVPRSDQGLLPIRVSFGHNPGTDADDKPITDTIKLFFCVRGSRSPVASIPARCVAGGGCVEGPFFRGSDASPKLAGAGPRLRTTSRVTLARPPDPQIQCKIFVFSFFVYVSSRGHLSSLPPSRPSPNPHSPLTGVN